MPLPDNFISALRNLAPLDEASAVAVARCLVGEMQAWDDECVLKPTLQGTPSSRERRYTIMLLKTELHPAVALDSQEFRNAFWRRVVVDGTVYMDSLSPSQLESYIKELAVSRGLPGQDVASTPWALDAVLQPGLATRCAEWNELARQTGIVRGFCDAEHHANHMASIMTVIPGLLQGSTIHSLFDRVLVPLEHFAVVGLPVLEPDRVSAGPCQSLLSRDMVGSLSSREIKSLCGNSMHVAVVGLMLNYVLVCTRKLRRPQTLLPSIRVEPHDDLSDDVEHSNLP